MILQDKVALVTGSTTGIGRATALAYPYGEASYAQRSVGAASRREGKLNVRVASRREVIVFGAAGAKVVFSGRRDAEGEKTAKLIRETGAECLYVH
ncbi:hypothetical protein IQ274_25895 [Nostoc sp. LEGE 12447]|uniref:hypothetical protein n=1 Tax=Nostoc sp. LEGE 12447 TaxID=1828640 RepID=UPI00188380AE|nr:hypothetical protein [Nostoc sp. LEGE 12447]